uniref:Uncharacterized protein n=1 Tax=Arundo donax TaxID=35708 RepID=A0A0A8YGE0_ARUDO
MFSLQDRNQRGVAMGASQQACRMEMKRMLQQKVSFICLLGSLQAVCSITPCPQCVL